MLLTLKKFNSSPPQLSHAPDSISRHSQQNTGAAQVPKHGNTSGLSWRHFCYFSWNISLWTLNNSCERHLPKHRTSRETIKDRWNVVVKESTTEHKLHFHPWKSEQRTRVWRGSKAQGTNCGTLLARPWGDKAMANVIPVCSNPILGRWQAGWPPGAQAPCHQLSVRCLLLHRDRFMHAHRYSSVHKYIFLCMLTTLSKPFCTLEKDHTWKKLLLEQGAHLLLSALQQRENFTTSLLTKRSNCFPVVMFWFGFFNEIMSQNKPLSMLIFCLYKSGFSEKNIIKNSRKSKTRKMCIWHL